MIYILHHMALSGKLEENYSNVNCEDEITFEKCKKYSSLNSFIQMNDLGLFAKEWY
jgi:hypothetical protein